VIFSIYGIDLNPGGASLLLTGVTAPPQFSFLSGETIFGNSGTPYTSTFASKVPIEELFLLLGPGFDLSPFSAGDPNSNVYVFQTIVPAAEITSVAPEPSTWVLSTSMAMLGVAGGA
jgi:hypothetical protein